MALCIPGFTEYRLNNRRKYWNTLTDINFGLTNTYNSCFVDMFRLFEFIVKTLCLTTTTAVRVCLMGDARVSGRIFKTTLYILKTVMEGVVHVFPICVHTGNDDYETIRDETKTWRAQLQQLVASGFTIAGKCYSGIELFLSGDLKWLNTV